MKPILFSTEMVRAILSDRKTMTRRVIKDNDIINHFDIDVDGSVYAYINPEAGDSYPPTEIARYQPGDILWVRETTYLYGQWVKNGLTKTGKQKYKFTWDKTYPVIYAADGKPEYVCKGKDEIGYYKRPSSFMPKEAARIFLRVTNVRVERLHDITEHDARNEGVKDPYDYQEPSYYNQPHVRGMEINKSAFAGLWDSLNAKRGYGWESNPWVWVYEFERVSEE